MQSLVHSMTSTSAVTGVRGYSSNVTFSRMNTTCSPLIASKKITSFKVASSFTNTKGMRKAGRSLLTVQSSSSSGRVRGGGRAERDLQEAENEARGAIDDLVTDLGVVEASTAQLEGTEGVTLAPAPSTHLAALSSSTPDLSPAEEVPSLNRPNSPPQALMAQSGGGSEVSASTSSDGEDVQGDMLKPTVANTPWVRLLAIAGAVAIASRGTTLLKPQSVAFVHLIAFGLWLGSNAWTTFFAGITMFKNLPRQTFGRLQSKLFPLYFQLSCGAIALMMGTLSQSAVGLPQSQVVILGLALAASLGNLLVAEPAATNVMFERYALENVKGVRDSARIAALYNQFGKWHGFSSVLNLGVLVAAFSHAWWLAGSLVLHTI